MRKSELIELLLEYGEDIKELRKMTKDELEELYQEYTDTTVMYPNGIDDDAENYGL